MRRDLLAYLPLLIVLALPVLACLVLMIVEPGIERALFYSAVKIGLVLVVLGIGLSFVASRLAGREEA